MKLKKIKNTFHQELDDVFDVEEVDSFFYILINHFYGLKRIKLAMVPDFFLEDADAVLNALELLKKQKPIQYIIGETEFYGLPFLVNDSVLIPRPETEELVDWIINKSNKKETITILDVGTGSGCIAISLAKHLANAKVFALDVSKNALAIAKQNAKLNEVNINFIEADILITNQIKSLKFDVIVSNPPYVREQEKAMMKPNVLENEPHLALFVKDENPLVFYKAIAQFAQFNLTKNGLLYFEINEYLGRNMINLLNDNNFKDIELRQDIFKRDRMIKGIKN